jgi:hypothetical protein
MDSMSCPTMDSCFPLFVNFPSTLLIDRRKCHKTVKIGLVETCQTFIGGKFSALGLPKILLNDRMQRLQYHVIQYIESFNVLDSTQSILQQIHSIIIISHLPLQSQMQQSLPTRCNTQYYHKDICSTTRNQTDRN